MPQQLTDSSPPSKPLVSVIIPTYNRRESLLLTLASLTAQTYPADRFEVVAVNDGGSDATDEVVQMTYPFRLLYLRQANRGSAAARNHGAQQSSGDVLVFIDDDMTLLSEYLAALVDKTVPGTIPMGVWQPYEPNDSTHFGRANARLIEAQSARATQDQEVPFAECTSNNLAVHRADFQQAGKWQDVLGDGPTLWGDVEFGYRAWKTGCRFVRIAGAKLVHRDQHMADLSSATKRAYHIARIVQPLFKVHPEIKEHLPMFRDKGPIAWRQDPSALVARKLALQVVSAPPVLRGMEGLVGVLERGYASPPILERLYRWISSAYIYHGYREGLKELEHESDNVAARGA